MPTPTIPAGNLFMNATLYTGTGAALTVANGVAGQNFQPDLVWFKSRSTATDNTLVDVLRGSTPPYRLRSNSTAAELTGSDGVVSFASTGINLDGTGGGGDVNTSGRTYVAWQWKAGGAGVSNTAGSITSTVSANPTAGFSVVTWTGNGTAGATVGHGLGATPSMVIVKRRSAASNWSVSSPVIGATKVLFLEQTSAAVTDNGPFNSTLASSSVITLGSSTDTNASGGTFVAYCWAEITGFSKFGSYTGNGSADGTFVYLGFRPKFVMWKNSTQGSQWILLDTARNTYNVSNAYLEPNTSDTENTASTVCDILSNGFKLRNAGGTDFNENANTYIYMAFAENPFKNALAR